MTTNPLREYYQIVGHTRIDYIRTIYTHNNTSVTFIDIIENHISKYGYLKENSFYSLKI